MGELVFQDQHRIELIRLDLVEANPNAKIQGRPKVQRTPEKLASFRCLGRLEFVQRAVVTAAAIGCVRAEARVAQVLAAQGPVHQEADGGVLRPLPVGQFGSLVF